MSRVVEKVPGAGLRRAGIRFAAVVTTDLDRGPFGGD
jgi:hypothetical protein